MEQKATIGRIVHYKSYGSPDAPEVRAAIITGVHSNPEQTHPSIVDLCVFTPYGVTFKQNVNYGEREGQWMWPPKV